MTIMNHSARRMILLTLATCGHLEICKILIDNGANLLALNGDGNMPYDICEDEATLDLIESEMDRAGITQELIDEARLVPEEKMLKEITTFLKDNSSNQIQSIKKILSYRDHDGATILHIASAYGYQKVIDYLIQRNVPLDSRDNDGWTPIHVAVFWGHIYVISNEICHCKREGIISSVIRFFLFSRTIDRGWRKYPSKITRRSVSFRFMRRSRSAYFYGQYSGTIFAKSGKTGSSSVGCVQKREPRSVEKSSIFSIVELSLTK